MRIARIVEGSETVALLVGGERIARSAGGVTIALEASAARWQGTGAARTRCSAAPSRGTGREGTIDDSVATTI